MSMDSYCCAPPILSLLLSLETFLDRLLSGEIDHIYLNLKVYWDGIGLELSSIKEDEGIEVFDYNSIGERHKNRAFLYLYVADLVDDLVREHIGSDDYFDSRLGGLW